MSKRYGRGDWVLRDVDVRAPEGEAVAFTGGNGSGKSTLLRIAVGLSKPTRGVVADHTQRYLAPVLVFTALTGVLTVNGSGSLPPAYASSAGALFVGSTWLTIALTSLDDAPQRAIVVISSGRSLKVLLAAVGTALTSCLVLMVFGLLFPLWVGDYEVVTASDLLLGLEAQLTCALVGIAIGVLCSRLVLRRQGYALVAALALVMVTLFVKGMPPVNRLFNLMATTSESAKLLAPAAGMLAIAAVILAGSTAVTQYVTSRKE
ncbi:ATP-binding cassette domain-containing protein [Streptomyces yunnanensis]|uniref:ATP-binding cassette domain-containing protein n=1 Tax=Streptomyces yunnanensis TaxID=156453 RepID=A0ABY8AHR8_9ACTN|nr:ATP-binding cassette domain-containing protein [Streptomyces yunnanensis]WEB44388.1 ATP-binding cassette domain-containing protein [Streptomyces yunnanensis]